MQQTENQSIVIILGVTIFCIYHRRLQEQQNWKVYCIFYKNLPNTSYPVMNSNRDLTSHFLLLWQWCCCSHSVVDMWFHSLFRCIWSCCFSWTTSICWSVGGL